MPTHSPADLAARPAQRSLVVQHPIGYFEAGALLLRIGLLAVGYGASYYLGQADAALDE